MRRSLQELLVRGFVESDNQLAAAPKGRRPQCPERAQDRRENLLWGWLSAPERQMHELLALHRVDLVYTLEHRLNGDSVKSDLLRVDDLT